MALLDQWGNPIDFDALTEEQAGPTLTGVRQILSGHPSWGLTPDRLAAILLEAETADATAFLELAEDMEEKDPHYFSVLGTRKRQVAQLEITVESATDDAADIANADLVREVIATDEIQDDLIDMLDALGKGYSATEIMWDTSEKSYWPERFEWRDPRWFRFDREDGRTLRLIDVDGQEQPLPPYKFIVHRPRLKAGLPIRGGLARAVAYTFLFKAFGIKDWLIFAEVFGMPLRLGKYGTGATNEEKAILLRAVRSISSDAAAIIPQSMEIEFPEAGGKTGSVDLYERMCAFLDQQVSKAVLGQTATTDAIKGGYAVGRTHDEVREDIEQSDARQLAATLNRDLVRPLIDLNRGPQKAYPRIVIGRAEQTDPKELSEVLERLVPLGLKVEQSVVRDRIGLPDPEEGADLLVYQTNAPPIEPNPDQKNKPDPALATALAAAENGVNRDAIDDLVDQAIDLAAPHLEAMVEAIRNVVETSQTLDEIDRRLLELFPGTSTAELEEILGQAMAVADLTGAAEVADG